MSRKTSWMFEAELNALTRTWKKHEAGGGISTVDAAARAWLLAPDPRTLARLEEELARVTPECPILKTTLRWLDFLGGGRPLPATALPDAESRLLDALVASRDRRHERPLFPLARHPLVRSLQLLTQPRPEPRFGEILVDVGHSEILGRDRLGRHRWRSRKACRALVLLKSSDSVTLSHFAQYVLEAVRYDERLHDHSISHLLTQLRKMMGRRLAFQRRSPRIYASGSWERIEIIDASAHLALRDSAVWQSFSESMRLGPPPARELQKSLPACFDRRAFERATGVSRSTANRLIARLLTNGELLVRGKGKRTSYAFRY